MNNPIEKILTIDISSNSVKTALVSDNLRIDFTSSQDIKILNEDLDGFAKRIVMDDLWDKICIGVKDVIQKCHSDNIEIIGISTCAQRIATVFLDKRGAVIYAGPNTDVRGIDSAYLIEDAFSEEKIFEITAHNPSLLFCLARLLWFKEEEEENYNKINKVLMLDDWLVYKFSGIFCTDLTSSAESQLIDIKKGNWSSEIIEEFDLNPDILPQIVESGSIIGYLEPNLTNKFDLKNKNIPIIKSGGDTQASLLGMGAIDNNNLGITLGTTAPLHLIIDKPFIDPNLTFWTSFHSIPGKWIIEAHAGNTGASYSWFKECFLKKFSEEESDSIIDTFLQNSNPGALSTFAYLGPELMNLKDQTSIKRGVFVFPPPMMVSEVLPKIDDFARSLIENIAFGIYENFKALHNFQISKVFCAGGMSKSKEILKVIANVLDTDLNVPEFKDTSFIGAAMNTLKALDYFKDYRSFIEEFIKFEIISSDPSISEKYKEIFAQWKNIKNKVDKL